MRNLFIVAAGLLIVCGYAGKTMSEAALKPPGAQRRGGHRPSRRARLPATASTPWC